ncbi:MAG TPA: GntR family transcriptional regulator [Cellvibrio sp.]|nr:GntR family transcriptional regulator [Cellvibrio sp.]
MTGPTHGALLLAKSAAQLVYDQLKQKIIDFEIYPGTRITESEIAEDFQVSRTPVRAALQRLETEGQITIMPKQGCFVRSVDIETISQYYDVRISLEATAVELACDHMSDEDLDAQQEVWNPERVDENLDLEDMEEIKAREEAFHIGIALGSGNLVLANYLRDINNHIRILRRLGFPDRQAVIETCEEHYAICQLIREHNKTQARRAMTKHIRKSQELARSVTLSQLQQAIKRHKPL